MAQTAFQYRTPKPLYRPKDVPSPLAPKPSRTVDSLPQAVEIAKGKRKAAKKTTVKAPKRKPKKAKPGAKPRAKAKPKN